MGFFGGQFLVQGFFGVLLEVLGIILGLDFWLYSIIPARHLKSECPPWASCKERMLEELFQVKADHGNCL